MFEIVVRLPGLNNRQIALRVCIPPSAAAYHLGRLKDYGLVELVAGERGGEVLCFHPAHVHLWDYEPTRVLYGQAPVRHVALYVHANPGTTTSEIAEAVDSAPRTILDHLKELRDRSLVERLWLHRRVEYHPTRTLEGWVEGLSERYPKPWIDDEE